MTDEQYPEWVAGVQGLYERDGRHHDHPDLGQAPRLRNHHPQGGRRPHQGEVGRLTCRPPLGPARCSYSIPGSQGSGRYGPAARHGSTVTADRRPMELLLLSNSTNYGEAMFSHAAEAFVEVVGRRPSSRSSRSPWPTGTTTPTGRPTRSPPRHRGRRRPIGRAAPDRAILDAEVVMMGGGNTFRLLDSLLRARRGRRPAASTCATARPGTWARRPAPTWPARRSAPPTTCRSASRRRSTRSALVPFQINLHYVDADPASTFMGETREERDRGVPRGERLPGARPVRGLVAAGRAATRRRSPGRPSCSSATGCESFEDGVDVSPSARAAAAVRRRPTARLPVAGRACGTLGRPP